jgi:Holliday junction resolvasome RuvABC ATP-dependent DNA helicase subunit
VNLGVTSGPAIERAGDVAAIVSDLEQGEVDSIIQTRIGSTSGNSF